MWHVIYPRLATTKDSIRHMVLALASRHEQRISQSPGQDDLAFLQLLINQHYSAALSALSQQREDSPEVLLLLAGMFVVYGCLEPNANQTAQCFQ